MIAIKQFVLPLKVSLCAISCENLMRLKNNFIAISNSIVLLETGRNKKKTHKQNCQTVDMNRTLFRFNVAFSCSNDQQCSSP